MEFRVIFSGNNGSWCSIIRKVKTFRAEMPTDIEFKVFY